MCVLCYYSLLTRRGSFSRLPFVITRIRSRNCGDLACVEYSENVPVVRPPTRGADSFKSTVVSRAGAGAGALRSSRDAPTRRQCVLDSVFGSWRGASESNRNGRLNRCSRRRVRIESERSFESMLTTARPNRIGTGVSDRSRPQAAPGAPLSRTGDSFSSFWMLAGALDRLA